MKRKIIAIIMIMVMCISLNAGIFAESITDLQNQKADAASGKKEAQDQLKDVKEYITEALSAIE